jgi:hypothetical protein
VSHAALSSSESTNIQWMLMPMNSPMSLHHFTQVWQNMDMAMAV